MLVKRVLAAHGRVDVLVNNAGVGALGYLDELSADDVGGSTARTSSPSQIGRAITEKVTALVREQAQGVPAR